MPETNLEPLSRAAGLALAAALLGLILGASGLWLGWQSDAVALMGLGGTLLLQVPLAFGLRGRIREGFGNRGLDREHRRLRLLGHLQRLAALGLALGGAAALMARRAPEFSLKGLFFGVACVLLLALAWVGKRTLAPAHPALALDTDRARLPLEIATLLLAGSLAGRWFPEADAVIALFMAGRVFQSGHTLAKATSLQAACGGCGGGCGCS